MSKYLDEHQREGLAKAFVKAKDKEGLLLRHAKKFAKENHAKGKPTQYDIDNHLKACRNLVASANGEVHIAWSKWKGRPPNPKKLHKSYDFVVDLMETVKYSATNKQKEQLAETLTSRGGKNFLKAIDEYIAERTKDELNAKRNEDIELLKSLEKDVADRLSRISDLSMIEGEDSFDSWANLLEMKYTFITRIYYEHESATGLSKSTLKETLKKIEPLSIDLSDLINFIELSSLATRLLQHWYLEDCIEELHEDDMKVALACACLSDKGWDDEDIVHPTHNSILADDREIVFKDKYLEHQILYSRKNKIVKGLIDVGNQRLKDFEKLINKIDKKLNGKKISYKWSTFFTNSIAISRDFQNEYSEGVIEHEKDFIKDADYETTPDLYRRLSLSSKIAKSLRAKKYKR